MEKLIASAIERSFNSPNVDDSNGEAANIVDVLNNIAKAIYKLGESIEMSTRAQINHTEQL